MNKQEQFKSNVDYPDLIMRCVAELDDCTQKDAFEYVQRLFINTTLKSEEERTKE